MVTAVCLNPSFDRIVHVKQFTYGGMNRVTARHEYPSGKAINVATALSSLGVQTRCIGFSRNANGHDLERLLRRYGIGSRFVYLDGEIRTNIKLLDESKSIVTEINEPGEPVTDDALERMTALFRECAADSDYLILTGSLPPGCPADYYQTLIGEAEKLRCRTVLDAEGEPLIRGLKARPFLVKPNRYELEMAAGRPLHTIGELVDAARKILGGGARYVAVSMGDGGALIVSADVVLYAPRVDVPVRSTVGAGDSMVAGLVAGFIGGLPLEQVFRIGVAAATASVTTEGEKLIEIETYKRLIDEIAIEKVEQI